MTGHSSPPAGSAPHGTSGKISLKRPLMISSAVVGAILLTAALSSLKGCGHGTGNNSSVAGVSNQSITVNSQVAVVTVPQGACSSIPITTDMHHCDIPREGSGKIPIMASSDPNDPYKTICTSLDASAFSKIIWWDRSGTGHDDGSTPKDAMFIELRPDPAKFAAGQHAMPEDYWLCDENKNHKPT